MAIASIEEALKDIRNGKMVIIVDDEDRENEGDVMMAAEKTTPEAINFMARYACGLICLSLTEERARHLKLPLMVRDNYLPLQDCIHRFHRSASRCEYRHFGVRPVHDDTYRHRRKNPV